MKYTKRSSINGAWIDKTKLTTGTKAKIVSETVAQPSTFTNDDGSLKTQDVCKLRIQGVDEPVNCSLNQPTINALVDAFGEDSKDWQGQVFTIEIEKVRVAGVARLALYLVPEGYVKTDDDNGYAVIVKQTTDFAKGLEATTYPERGAEEINVEDIPF